MVLQKVGGGDEITVGNVDVRFNDVAIEKLNEFCNMMRISGYDRHFRKAIIEGVYERVKAIEVAILRGERCRYRNRLQITEMHRASKGRYLNTWFMRGGGEYTSVLNVQPTPGGGC